MKKQFLILLLAVTACSQDAAKSVVPTFKSVDGVWKFQGKDTSGQFTIISVGNTIWVDNTSGNFITINGKTYPITSKVQIPENYPAKLRIQLSNQVATVFLSSAEVNSSFTEMVTTGYVIESPDTPQRSTLEQMKITR